MDNIDQATINHLDQLSIDSPKKTLVLIRDYDESYAGEPNYELNIGGILINIGRDLFKKYLVEEGIHRIKKILSDQPAEHAGIFYNLANGYSALNNIKRGFQNQDYVIDIENTKLLKAKEYFRKSIELDDQFDPDTRAQLWINYGNCLSGLGRTVEALSAYDKALNIFPNHPMAKVNLAIELYYFSNITRHSKFIIDSYVILKNVLSNKKLESYASPNAIKTFKHHKNHLATLIEKHDINLDSDSFSDLYQNENGYLEKYINFCLDNKFFLNLCYSCRKCNMCIQDNVSFSLLSDIDENNLFIRLSRVINEVKVQYAFSRFLLFQALNPNLNTIAFDEITSFVDNLDYAVYGIRVSSIKRAFESAYNILDKIAHFLNDYLEIGLTYDPKIKFTTNGEIWRKNRKGQLRTDLVNKANYHLFALYDIARELNVNYKNPSNDGYWGHLRRTRNALVHEYLILHLERSGWSTDADDKSLHMMYDEFVSQTFDLFKLIRSAIIYLIAMIDFEERKKYSNSNGLLAPLYTPNYDHQTFTPGIDEVL